MPTTGRMSASNLNLSGPIIQTPQNPLDDFDPNDRDKGTPPWATYTPARRPAFKVHKMRGHAISALRNHGRYSGGILYRHEGGRWVEECRFNPHTFRPRECEHCRQPALKDEERLDFQTNAYVKTGRKVPTGTYTLMRERGKLTNPLVAIYLCPECGRTLAY